jgi:hypothetical protein
MIDPTGTPVSATAALINAQLPAPAGVPSQQPDPSGWAPALKESGPGGWSADLSNEGSAWATALSRAADGLQAVSRMQQKAQTVTPALAEGPEAMAKMMNETLALQAQMHQANMKLQATLQFVSSVPQSMQKLLNQQ